MELAPPPPRLEVETVFRALSDKTRLRILALLRAGELCVCDLVCVLDVPQPTASRHLAYLRKTGLVQARKAGLWHYYRLTSPVGPFHQTLLTCLATMEPHLPELASDRQTLQCNGLSSCEPASSDTADGAARSCCQ